MSKIPTHIEIPAVLLIIWSRLWGKFIVYHLAQVCLAQVFPSQIIKLKRKAFWIT